MKLLPALLFSLLAAASHAAPVISEFLADNDGGLKDENGDDEDWIEIHNPDPVPVDLAGWRLSNHASLLSAWTFPSRILPPGGRLLVWASSKNRRPAAGNLHTDFKLDQDGEYLALISPAGTVSTEFSPVFPFQSKNRSFGRAYAGTVTVTDLTPLPFVPNTNVQRIRISGPATATTDASLNLFDDGLPQPEHQQYLWFDYSARLGFIPAGHTIVDAVMEWSGTSMPFAGVSALSTVPVSIGIHQVPGTDRGLAAVASSANGNDLISFAATNPPTDALSILPGATRSFIWNAAPLVRAWLADPAMTARGQVMLLPSAHPCWIAWDQNRMGPKLSVRSVNSPNPVEAWGFMTPTPGSPNSGASAAGPLIRNVTENPPQPPAASPLVISARISPSQGGPIAAVQLLYRRNYEAEVSLPMNDAGENGDASPADGIFSASIPAATITAGAMIRWKIRATDVSAFSSLIPPFADPIDSPQYFGTVPVDPSINTQLTVVHRFIQSPATAATTGGTRAAIFLNGEFYDNVGINIHGQSTTGAAFLKKSYDIDSTRGYRFKWSLDPAQPRAKDINLLTVYADKSRVRHDLAYEMQREAGVAAHYCFLTHNRLNGTFDGLYDFVEDADDVYLERAGLNKDGALYKMYNGMSNPATDAITGVEKKNRKLENNADLYAFIVGINLADEAARKAFLFDNIDLPKMVNFMAANTVTGNVDLHAKNYYIYRDSNRSDLWTLLPWDLDLSQGRLWTAANNYFDDGIYLNAGGTLSGQGQSLIARLYAIPEISAMVRRRLRSLQDQFFKTSASAPDLSRWYDRRLSELAARLGASITPGQNDLPGSDAALDYARYPAAAWKNHTAVTGNTAASIFASYTTSQEMQRVLSSWVVQRINTINSDPLVPPAYQISSLLPLVFATIEHSPVSGNQDQEFIALTNPNGIDIDLSNWSLDGGISFSFEPGTVINAGGRLIIAASRSGFKSRTVSPKPGESLAVTGPYQGNLSNLGESLSLIDPSGTIRASTTYPGQPSPYQEFLAITEIMYNPGGNGLAEFIELSNISNSVTLDLTGVRFTNGISFSFTTSAITSLAPGARVLVVRDSAAFAAAYGPNLPVAGTFADNTNLNNAGESLKLEDPQNNTIADFAYDDEAPWPTSPDGTGPSLVLVRPHSKPDPAIAANWRASSGISGNPGISDSLRLTPGSEFTDADKDGIPALLEYASGSSDSSPGRLALSTSQGSLPGNIPFTEIVFPHASAAEDATLLPESSSNLSSWSSSGWSLIESTPSPSGPASERWRLIHPGPSPSPLFIRLRASRRP